MLIILMKDEMQLGNNPVFSKCLHHGFFHSIFLPQEHFPWLPSAKSLATEWATLSQAPLAPNLLIRTAPSGCHTVSEPGPNLMLPLLSHSTPSTTSCRCGLQEADTKMGLDVKMIHIIRNACVKGNRKGAGEGWESSQL